MVRNSSSVIEVTTRLPSVPLNFANELPSKRTVMVLLASSTVYVPYMAITPWAMALV